MVYKAIPPLYSIKEGKKNRYFTEQRDIVKFIQNKFSEKYTMSVGKEPLANRAITDFLIDNADYIYFLERVSNTYAVNPYLLEMILNNYVSNKNKINFAKLSKDVKAQYRFMNVEKANNNIIVKGTIDKVNTLIISDKFINDCIYILNIIRKNERLYYNINGETKSIYEIMKLYESVTPASIQRYKGLGEMDTNELAESTLYPGSNRTLVRYTLEDVKETIEAVREYESNPKKILGLIGNVTRDDLAE